MNILGIDPGATTGWVAYHSRDRDVMTSGQFEGFEFNDDIKAQISVCDVLVVERPKGYGPTRPQVVDCAYVCGRIVERARELMLHDDLHELTRVDVKNTLREATHGEVSVKNDAGCWAALLLLHGGDNAAKKGGPLHGVRSHERAALAVAVAWALRQDADCAKARAGAVS